MSFNSFQMWPKLIRQEYGKQAGFLYGIFGSSILHVRPNMVSFSLSSTPLKYQQHKFLKGDHFSNQSTLKLMLTFNMIEWIFIPKEKNNGMGFIGVSP